MYGADFSTYAGKTVYHWSTTTGEMTINGAGQGASATNTVYEALWDGGGVDIYDLRNYSSDLQVDLNPGEWSTFDTAQLADLDSGDPGVHFAHGNIANAHLYNDDRRSLIERAYGGGGDDTITGNIAKNYLVGGAGDDHLDGAIGADLLGGGRGVDTFRGGAGGDAFAFRALTDSTVDHMDLITDLALSDTIDVSRIDANTRKAGDQAFHIVHNFSGHAAEMVVHYDSGSGRTIVSMDVDGDRTADSAFAIDGNHHTFSNFVL
jgi:serralysin